MVRKIRFAFELAKERESGKEERRMTPRFMVCRDEVPFAQMREDYR